MELKKIFVLFILMLFVSSLVSQTIEEKYKLEKQVRGDITWYTPKGFGTLKGRGTIYPYIGVKYNSPLYTVLRLKIVYRAADWLYIEKIIFMLDQKRFPFIVEKGMVKREVEEKFGGKIKETIDLLAAESVVVSKLISNIAVAKKGKLRFEGKKFYSNRKLRKKHFTAFKNVIAAYRELLRR